MNLNLLKIGITEKGDAALDFSWVHNMNSVAMAVLITKNPTDAFIKKAFEYKDKVVIHLTCTGMGHTVLEPNVPRPVYIFAQYDKMLDMGFRPEQFVLRIDPIIPTEKGIKTAMNVLKFNEAMGTRAIKRIRFSFLDMYSHVAERFKKAGLPHPYGDGNFQAPQRMMEAAFEALKPYAEKWEMTTCAEAIPAKYSKHFKQSGCISADDVKVVGLDIQLGGSSNQRKGCMCPSNKTELLSCVPGQCAHGCLYCFWKNDFKPGNGNKPQENKEAVKEAYKTASTPYNPETSKEVVNKTTSKPEVEIWTDGGSHNNGQENAVGGWAAIMLYTDKNGKKYRAELKGAVEGATNNQMEMTAVIEALKKLKTPSKVAVYSDSAYVVNAFQKGWIKTWKDNNWTKDGGLKNAELWKELYRLVYESGHEVVFNKVEGHAGVGHNDEVDAIVQAAIYQFEYEKKMKTQTDTSLPETQEQSANKETTNVSLEADITAADEVAYDSFEIPADLDIYESYMPPVGYENIKFSPMDIPEVQVSNVPAHIPDSQKEPAIKKEDINRFYDDNGMFII